MEIGHTPATHFQQECDAWRANYASSRTRFHICLPKTAMRERNIQYYYLIYLLTAIGFSPGGSTHLHTNCT
jgi:hypothetical protein